MFCGKCGQQIPDNASVCPYCGEKTGIQPSQGAPAPSVVPQGAPQGAPQQAYNNPQGAPQQAYTAPQGAPQQAYNNPQGAPQQPGSDSKKPAGKIILIAAVAAVAVIALILVVPKLIGGIGGGSGQTKDWVFGTYVGFNTYLFANQDGETVEVEDVDYTYSNPFLTAYITSDGDKTLYYVNNDLEEIEVADEVISVDLGISKDYFAYFTGDDYESCELYLYNVSNGKSTQISKDVNCSYLCLSPDGKTVAFLKDYEGQTDNTLCIGGVNMKDSQKVDKDGCFPVAISNNGKNLFFLEYDPDNYEYTLKYYNGKDSVKLSSEVSTGSISTNADVTELVYSKDDGKCYYYKAGMEDPVKVSSSSLYFLYNGDMAQSGYVSSYCTAYSVSSLKNAICITGEGSLAWFNKDGTDTEKIASSYNGFSLSSNGKSIVYASKGSLYRMDGFSASMKEEELYDDEDVQYVLASSDLSRIYFTTDEDSLYCCHGKKVELISNDIDDADYYSLAYDEASKQVFFLEDGDLYCAGTNSKSKKKVEEDVEGVANVHTSVVYGVEDDDELTVYLYKDKKPIEVYSGDY